MTIPRIEEGAHEPGCRARRHRVPRRQVGTLSDDVEAQTNQVLAKIDDLLARAGSGRDRLLRATILLADMQD